MAASVACGPSLSSITPRLRTMEAITRDVARLRAEVTACLNRHDLLGVLDHGAPEEEYDPEMNDFAAFIAEGVPITSEVVAAVWQKWFGGICDAPEPPSAAMAALAGDLQAIR